MKDVGPPASCKTQFLMEIMKAYEDAEYFDGTNTTSRILGKETENYSIRRSGKDEPPFSKPVA